jgi:hypothetical protein
MRRLTWRLVTYQRRCLIPAFVLRLNRSPDTRSPSGFAAGAKVQNFSVPRVKISTAFMTTPSASTPHLVDTEPLEFLFSAALPMHVPPERGFAGIRFCHLQ